MEMTADDIVRSYNGASQKNQQLMVLAELNACSRWDIAQVLMESGIEFTESKQARLKRMVDRDMAQIIRAMAPAKQNRRNNARSEKKEAVSNVETEKTVEHGKKSLPDSVKGALMMRIEALDDEILAIKQNIKELEEYMAQKENEYAEICEYMGVLKRD